LAVLLILLGALGATVMVMRAGNKVSVVEITDTVAAGEPIPPTAIKEVMVSDDTDMSFILWKQRGDLTSHYRAATTLVKDSILVQNMITDKDDVLTAGKSMVGLSLKDGQFYKGIAVGDTVAAYYVGTDAGKSATGSSTGTSSGSTGGAPPTGGMPIATGLTVKSAVGNSQTGNESVTVVANSGQVSALTIAASANSVALVLVPPPTAGN
jgi:hypothetical protein